MNINTLLNLRHFGLMVQINVLQIHFYIFTGCSYKSNILLPLLWVFSREISVIVATTLVLRWRQTKGHLNVVPRLCPQLSYS